MSIRPTTLRAATLVLSAGMGLAALTGCGGDAAGEGGAADSPAGSPSSSAAEPTADATAPADPAAAEAEVAENWEAFFANGDPAMLEEGDQLVDEIALLISMAPPPQVITAPVQTVTFTGPDTATVTYDLTIDGEPVLPGATGQAAQDDGAWKVSKDTFCTLVALGSPGNPTPGCS